MPDPYEPCACGSGKKYKFCCLQKDREAAEKKAETEKSEESGEAAKAHAPKGFEGAHRGERSTRKSLDDAGSRPADKCLRKAGRGR